MLWIIHQGTFQTIEKNKLYNRVDKIENDISEIKELLMTMLKTGKINAD